MRDYNEEYEMNENDYREVSTASELGRALNDNEVEILISENPKLGDLCMKVRVIGASAWAAVLAGVGVAVGAVALTAGSGGTAAPVTGQMTLAGAGIGVAAIGGPTLFASAVGLAAAGGGVGVLRKLRGYRAVRRGSSVLLTRR